MSVQSAYRALLRELPRRNLSNPAPLHVHVRDLFRAPRPASESASELSYSIARAEQVAAYARAQREYVNLLDRYNPGIEMGQEERVRLTARRVGLDLPKQSD
ncbi:hypothetical protein ASPZODRAFT_1776158 [Penicilliopsis zonata CBS 506.65]|uniref:Uncharacterized protein n=1 Tax=Penicilliopsis zonata CBS 506.65 TaxID=1073090 RepID=A0A1L9SKX9_9EURO|nr:hypothetical protein ASPZODRAFT_1776158 [Penicilliopsis zonata CBS 506.65]OJJ47773.1 hypothetical protein ASPZODRAFT_1776158 [Penicilliopsis zonata CBS 506.65]